MFPLAQNAQCVSRHAAVRPVTAAQTRPPRTRRAHRRTCQPLGQDLPAAPGTSAGRYARPDRGPARCRIARQRYPKCEPWIAACESREFLVIDHILACADRVQERCGHSVARQSPMPQHAHERNNPTPAANQQKRTPRFQRGPGEMPSDRPAQLNRVVGLQLAGEERRHLAVIQAVDREL
jgi:hypothetical protein